MDVSTQFKNKKITVMGLGLLGRGIGDVRFLAECGAHVTVTDLKSEDQLKDSIAQLTSYPHITFVLGEHRESDFTGGDLVLKAPATPKQSPFIQAAERAGVPVSMSTAYAAKIAMDAGVKVVGITGTRGKSTITQMIYDTLVRAGVRAHLGGNVRGVSTLALLPDMQAGDVLVLELDSWQLQGFGAERISPHIAVFGTFMQDHLNYYKDENEYFADKALIFNNQKEGDVLIVGEQASGRVKAAQPKVAPVVPPPLPDDWKLAIPGEHNRYNASLAKAALEAIGVSDEVIKAGLEQFAGVEGRLEYLGEKNGVRIYNDNNATTPAATVAALKSFTAGTIVLIAGGTDKGISLDDMVTDIKKCTKTLILIDPTATGTQKMQALFPDAPVFGSVKEAAAAAKAAAAPGDVLLFSPAFSSFGIFKNEYDRNDQFKHAIKSI